MHFFSVMNLIENGMIQRWRRKFYPPNRCAVPDGISMATSAPATIEDVQGIFILIFAGVFLGAIILVIECSLMNSTNWCWVRGIRKVCRHIRLLCRRVRHPTDSGGIEAQSAEAGDAQNGSALEMKVKRPAAKKGTIFAIAGVGMTYKETNASGGVGAIGRKRGVDRWYYRRRDM